MTSNYFPEDVAQYINDDAAIASADIEKIGALITYCVSGECFCDGHLGMMIRNGRIIDMLQRMEQLLGR